MSARRSSSDISGLKTTMDSYCLSPGGHCGSGFSSTGGKPITGVSGSSPEPSPPSKNELVKSRVCALTLRLEWWFLFRGKWKLDSENARMEGAEREEEDERGIELSEEDVAIDAIA